MFLLFLEDILYSSLSVDLQITSCLYLLQYKD